MKRVAKIGYSMRSKISPPQPEAEKVPGPGSYKENNFFSPSGAVFMSKYANHKATRFDSGGERFKKFESPNPGPGRYDTSTT